LKIKKYFNFIKENRNTFVDLDYSYLKTQSQTAYESVISIQEKIQHKIADTFENQDRKQQIQFDMTKLETIKEKTNKNFFEKMETLKNTKKTVTNSNNQTNQTDDLLDLDTDNVNQSKAKNDLFNLDFDDTPHKQTTKTKDVYGDLDLLASDEKNKVSKTVNTDLLIDFQDNLNVSKPVQKKADNLIDSDMFKDLNPVSKPEVKVKENNILSQQKDPFDFISF